MAENQNTPYMNWSSPDLAGTFKLFQQKCDLYFTVRDIIPAQRASHILLLYVGDEGLRIFNSWSLSAADAVNPNLIMGQIHGTHRAAGKLSRAAILLTEVYPK